MTRQARHANAEGGKRYGVYRAAARSAVKAARKAGREARHTAADVASSVEARLAIRRARAAVNTLGKAALAATTLILAACRTSGGRIRTFAGSRELRALRTRARKAASAAANTAHAASAAAGVQGVMTWKRAMKGGKVLAKRIGHRLRGAARK
jgi:hypothetical protein